MKPLVIYHGGGCMDGFCAAWLFHKAFPDADFVAANYGEAPPIDYCGRDVFIVDFSYPREIMHGVIGQSKMVTVLDHHKTAKAALEGLTDEWPSDRLHITFDMGKSGGRLAWEHLCEIGGDPAVSFYSHFGSITVDSNRADEVPWLVAYTEDRDLWLWKMPNSKEISAWLGSVPRDFEAWDIFNNPGWKEEQSRIDQGAAILRYQQQIVDSHCDNAVEIEMDGHKVLSLNATTLVSEIGEKLAQDRPFSATYFIRQDGMKVWSLRSRGESGIDVSEVAARRGGGGHRNASGFQEPSK